MFQYIARLKSSKEIICSGHSITDIEHQVKHFKRQQKNGEHTKSNEIIQVVHIHRNGIKGKDAAHEELIKEI